MHASQPRLAHRDIKVSSSLNIIFFWHKDVYGTEVMQDDVEVSGSFCRIPSQGPMQRIAPLIRHSTCQCGNCCCSLTMCCFKSDWTLARHKSRQKTTQKTWQRGDSFKEASLNAALESGCVNSSAHIRAPKQWHSC